MGKLEERRLKVRRSDRVRGKMIESRKRRINQVEKCKGCDKIIERGNKGVE